MKFIDYLKDNVISILIYIITLALASFILVAFKLDYSVIIVLNILFIISGILIISLKYYHKNKFYKVFFHNLERLSKKYLILKTLPDASTYEEKLFVNALYDINKSMIENINLYENNIIEFKEFVEIWIHEVKIPISSMVLKCHNHKEKYDKSFFSLIRRLDNNIDEILYYVRSENTEKDFSISEVDLKEVVRNVGIKNKDDLLENKICFESNIPSKIIVHSDKKWLEFIINQIMNNCIKYKKGKDSFININVTDSDDKVSLEIYDNGIGIPKKDLPRVFEKSFTGSNGRDKVKSTGMGLYIIKKLCDRLGHNIMVVSIESEYTKVIIEFGKNKMYKF